jgi:putative Mn2+ efflux pump MntP
MKMDLRLPIGLMFGAFGVMLTLFGLFSDRSIYQRSLGINVNLWWGLVLLVFGLVMLAFGIRGEREKRATAREESRG